MKLSDVFKSISATLMKPLNAMKFKNISEESVRAQIEDAKWALNAFQSVFGMMSEKQFAMLYEKVTARLNQEANVVKSIGRPTADILLDLPKQLKGSARSAGLYKSINLSTKSLIKMLDVFEEHIPEIIGKDKTVTMKDFKISHTVFFGALESVNMFNDFNGYLIALLSHTLMMPPSGSSSLPKYMGEFLVSNGMNYLDLVNKMTDSSGSSDIINTILDLKKKGMDVQVASDDRTKHHLVLTTAMVGSFLLKAVPVIVAFWLSMGGIARIGEMYIDIRHQYYERLKERKKWLEGHIANIKMILENIDPNDPEYVKLQKVIAFYDDEVAKLDKKIKAYYEE